QGAFSNGSAGLSEAQEEAIEKELLEALPSLAPLGDPKYVRQLWKISRGLVQRRAYCLATKKIAKIDELVGPISDEKAFAGQAYFMCAKMRLSQGFVAEAASKLQNAIAIFGERPEYQDLLFKLALIRAKNAVDRADTGAISEGLEEAQRLSLQMVPGRDGGPPRWTRPLMKEAVSKVSGWSRDLLDAKNSEMAGKVATMVLEVAPEERIADRVKRDIAFQQDIIPAITSVVGGLFFMIFLWSSYRRFKIYRAGKAVMLDDDDDDNHAFNNDEDTV
ncbi:hypothetical protein KAI87_17555, partial [Myxococcota bacterium]|nr:hypothetical protein [Myxococcota bacterium]